MVDKSSPGHCFACPHQSYCPHFDPDRLCGEELDEVDDCGCPAGQCCCPYPGYDISHSDIGFNGRSGG